MNHLLSTKCSGCGTSTLCLTVIFASMMLGDCMRLLNVLLLIRMLDAASGKKSAKFSLQIEDYTGNGMSNFRIEFSSARIFLLLILGHIVVHIDSFNHQISDKVALRMISYQDQRQNQDQEQVCKNHA